MLGIFFVSMDRFACTSTCFVSHVSLPDKFSVGSRVGSSLTKQRTNLAHSPRDMCSETDSVPPIVLMLVKHLFPILATRCFGDNSSSVSVMWWGFRLDDNGPKALYCEEGIVSMVWVKLWEEWINNALSWVNMVCFCWWTGPKVWSTQSCAWRMGISRLTCSGLIQRHWWQQ